MCEEKTSIENNATNDSDFNQLLSMMQDEAGMSEKPMPEKSDAEPPISQIVQSPAPNAATTPQPVQSNPKNEPYELSFLSKAVLWFLAVIMIVGGIDYIVTEKIIVTGILAVISGIVLCPAVKISLKFWPRIGIAFLIIIAASFFLP